MLIWPAQHRLTMKFAIAILASSLVSTGFGLESSPNLVRVLGPQAVNLWRLDAEAKAKTLENAALRVQDSNESLNSLAEFPVQVFEQSLDHFGGVNGTFNQRYWVNSRHYTSGGPVIVLDGGETSGEDRLQFLDTGIVEILAKATGGLGVVLEHRYYGESIPVPDFSTDNLRFLSNEQAAADSANFMANVKFEGIEDDLTAPNTPWIYYGGSYAGARAAHMKILYPDLVFGAIASSGVTHAALSNWQYMDIIRRAADPACMRNIEQSIQIIDTILTTRVFARPLKGLFGLADLEHDVDFVSTIESPLGSWQSKNWNPAIGSTRFDAFCAAVNAAPAGMANLTDLPFGARERLVPITDGLSLDFALTNYAKYIKDNVASRCRSTVEECFGTFDDSQYQAIGLDQDWRLWTFQVCTQWGYFTTAPPDPRTPRIISKLLTLDYESKICKQAYPPGKHITVPPFPNVTAVNILGDFAIAADRLAIIDGEVDPWRPDTPHSDDAKPRPDTALRPFKLIPDAVHHYDEYGLADMFAEPPEILKIHNEMIIFVQDWLAEFKAPKKARK
ncbi:hypothetical protein EYR36_005236 [Pleurotus pulmonarius]|nr:hypothetical protein EYR36_005236 [Pleurotus pulmonarius]